MRWFLPGAALYPLMELAARGRTHYSMAVAGGLGGAIIGRLSRSRLPLPLRALAAGAGITAVEAGAGLVWNRRHQVWDYRRQPLQWRGQICLGYALLWTALSAGVLAGADAIRRNAGQDRRRPHGRPDGPGQGLPQDRNTTDPAPLPSRR